MKKVPITAPPQPRMNKVPAETPGPLISIITPVYNTSTEFITECYTSILNQKYTNWEWCICDDGSSNKEILNCLNKFNANSKVKIKYNAKNKGISLATIDAVTLAQGEIITFLDHDDELHEDALLEITNTLKNYDVDIIYTDEALKGNKITYHYKPNFSPHYLLSSNYICHLVAVKRSLYDSIGGIRPGFDGSQDHDLILRLTSASKKIFHIPKALYYWRVHSNSYSRGLTKSKTIDSGMQAVQEAIQRRGLTAVTKNDSDITHYSSKINIIGNPKVNIVIPISNTYNKIYEVINTIFNITKYNNYDITIISNDIVELEKVYKSETRINLIKNTKDIFSTAQILNLGIKQTNGEYIFITHDDIFIQTPDWIEWLVGYAQDSIVGVVGGKLYDTTTSITGACGTLIKDKIVFPTFNSLKKDDTSDFRRSKLIQNTSVIFNSMMLFKRDRYDSINGFDEKFINLYSDLDFSLRLKNAGYFNVYIPQCEALHLQNDFKVVPRSYEEINKINELDTLLFKNRYSRTLETGDPYHNINLPLNNINITKNIKKPKVYNILEKPIKLENKSKNNLVSYIIPWYNDIPIAIASLLVQTHKNIEIIAVYDGPAPSNVKNYIQNFADERIKFYNTDIRYNDWGHTPRNFGIDKLSSNSIATVFSGADNYYLPSFTENLIEPMISNPSIVATYCDMSHNMLNWGIKETKLAYNYIDCGCFMVATHIAHTLRWGTAVSWGWEDWKFIDKVINEYGLDKIMKISKMLYVHN